MLTHNFIYSPLRRETNNRAGATTKNALLGVALELFIFCLGCCLYLLTFEAFDYKHNENCWYNQSAN